jgi:alpha-1,3-rhamnosyl/mannosyltransferase
MRIAVNAIPLLQDALADTGNVLSEIFFNLCRQHPEAEFLLINNRPLPPSRPLPANARLVELKPLAGGKAGRYIWREMQWPRALKKLKADKLLCMDDVLPVPDGMPAHLLLGRRTAVLDSVSASKYIRRYASISLFSAFMREQLNKRFGGLDGKVHQLQPGAADVFRRINWEEREDVKREFAGGMEYFIALGSIDPANNIIPLLKAFSMLKKRLLSSVKLVLAGQLTDAGHGIADALQSYKFRDDVIWLRETDDETLARLVAGSYALVHTAGADGLAVPVYAALRCDVPAVALYAGAAPEAGGDATLNALPDDVTDLSEKMGALYKDELLRGRLLAHITPVPGWEDAARALGSTIIG